MFEPTPIFLNTELLKGLARVGLGSATAKRRTIAYQTTRTYFQLSFSSPLCILLICCDTEIGPKRHQIVSICPELDRDKDLFRERFGVKAVFFLSDSLEFGSECHILAKICCGTAQVHANTYRAVSDSA